MTGAQLWSTSVHFRRLEREALDEMKDTDGVTLGVAIGHLKRLAVRIEGELRARRPGPPPAGGNAASGE